jgi:uncharacterized membrane-anchored protein
MSVVAAIRPDEWNFPLLMHVLGAMLLVGGLVAAVTAFTLGWRRDSAFFSRIGFWSLLLVAFPAWWVMRIGAQWIYSKEGFDSDDEPGWLGVGYLTADFGGILLLLALILTGIGVRQARGREAPSILIRIGTVLVAILVLAYTIAVWAMSAKPD